MRKRCARTTYCITTTCANRSQPGITIRMITESASIWLGRCKKSGAGSRHGSHRPRGVRAHPNRDRQGAAEPQRRRSLTIAVRTESIRMRLFEVGVAVESLLVEPHELRRL